VSLEFLVIGAQKAGTTTLWQLLRDHPQLWLPETKEAPFFSHDEVYARGWDAYLTRLEAPANGDLLRGTVTPHYMHGWQQVSTDMVASRIASCLPDVKLIALLRDPVERARSQHAMASARGRERRGIDQAISELLHPEALRRARRTPDDTNSYVVQGEYGRILGEYLTRFPRTALHLEYSDSLARTPIETVKRILRFLAVSLDYEPPAPFRRSFAGGHRPRVPDLDLLELLRDIDAAPTPTCAAVARAWAARRSLDETGGEELELAVQRYVDSPGEDRARARKGLEFTLRKTWNVAPSPPEPISEEARNALEAHYAPDVEKLRLATGVTVPVSVRR
jgi:Sulfotransferase domain